MGISASQARLLSITARLTSNEYESQQLSNAKMRLAMKSEKASAEYIAALDERQLQFITYDAKGSKVTQDLTANAIYQYSDMKNQYALVNASGQMMVNRVDAKNFEAANNLDEFLALYGLEKQYKSTSLASNAKKLEENAKYYDDWENAVRDAKLADYEINGVTKSSDEAYAIEKNRTFIAYQDAIEYYEDQLHLQNSGISSDVPGATRKLTEAKIAYEDCVTYDTWVKSKAMLKSQANKDNVYENSLKYFEVLADVLAEAEDLGITSLEDISTYEDKSKAQWYTNLWYRMNGHSTDKSAEGKKGTNYTELDPKLANSKAWLEKALSQGIVTLEVAANKETTKEIIDENNPFSMKLKGIEWNATEYGSGRDFVEADNDAAVAKAEAKYKKENDEISAKDTKYQNKIKSLDIEHNTLQTQLESVKSAMTKNIDRSYKTFSG